jgi:GNAT superfamily N-acetyltransferase
MTEKCGTSQGLQYARSVKSAPEEGHRMYVCPENRGYGVAQAILKQPAALALYARQGYKQTGPFGGYLAHPLSVFMCKALSGQPTLES